MFVFTLPELYKISLKSWQFLLQALLSPLSPWLWFFTLNKPRQWVWCFVNSSISQSQLPASQLGCFLSDCVRVFWFSVIWLWSLPSQPVWSWGNGFPPSLGLVSFLREQTLPSFQSSLLPIYIWSHVESFTISNASLIFFNLSFRQFCIFYVTRSSCLNLMLCLVKFDFKLNNFKFQIENTFWLIMPFSLYLKLLYSVSSVNPHFPTFYCFPLCIINQCFKVQFIGSYISLRS